ncbi:MAG: tRNA epoxyqueuosine(34) reductase QueG [Longimicrobiales bacterium]
MPVETSLTDRIRDKAHELGFESVGFTPLRPSDHEAVYRAWIAAGHHGEMGYLARPDAVEARLNPQRQWPQLKSAIVATMRYAGADEEQVPADRGIISRYARGRDYHKVIKKKQLELLRWLEAETGQRLEAARAYVDTGPVLERELAQRAGLGWQGRSAMLLHPRRGSYVFLSTLLVELDLQHDEPFTRDHCGTCTACISACPTGALLGRDGNGAPIMDARRCISYLTIEQRGAIPRELRPAIGNRIFGCDVCQEVCPFSRKFSAPSSEPSFAARGPGEPPVGVEPLPSDGWHPGTDAPLLVDLMSMDGSGWEAFSRGSALRRAGRAGFRRNVAVALGNWGDEAAVPPLTSGLGDSDPLVRSHSAWALGRVGSASAVAALETALAAETDHAVIVEIKEALAAASSTSAAERGVPAR